ncbi:hypothetical protein [Clostridium nigeriense]|uniref:hypothetical protein n=1 Tax=Clostridium nigeriense TaxID=1805470 RepID=UPI000834E701|nr:hypothetical protein [Clostridium nigeriense]
MEMNEILNGLNSCGCNDGVAPQCPTQPIGPCNNNGCFGFGSWIWILLILFYSGGFGGGYNNNRCCCKKQVKSECCCGRGNAGYGGLGNCTPYLFLLVILFLCNGCSGFGNCGNFGNGNLFGGCC